MNTPIEVQTRNDDYSQGQYGLFIIPDEVCDTDYSVDTVMFSNSPHDIVARRSSFENVRDTEKKYNRKDLSRYYVSCVEMENAVQHFYNSPQYRVNAYRDTFGNSFSGPDFEQFTSTPIDAIWVTNGDGQTLMLDRRGNIHVHSSGEDVENVVLDMISEFVSITKEPLVRLATVYEEFGIKTSTGHFGETDVSIPLRLNFDSTITFSDYKRVWNEQYNKFTESTTFGDHNGNQFRVEIINTQTYSRYKIRMWNSEHRIFAYDDETLCGVLSLLNLAIDTHEQCPDISIP